MNNQIVKINNTDLSIKEFKGQRVVTFKDIDTMHNRRIGTASRNFRNNRQHFINGQDFFEITKNDVAESFTGTYGFDDKAPKGYLITESGYLMLVKSFTDDLSWKVQRELVNNYFKKSNIPVDLHAIEQMFDEKLNEARQYYKIKAKSKSDISSYIKKRLGILRADGEYEAVKARVFLLTGISKWEDLDMSKLKDILPVIDESIKVIKSERPEQTSFFD